MLLLADGLFRLDVALLGDTLRTLSQLLFSDMESYRPGQGRMEFTLGAGGDRVSVEVMIATLHFARRGAVQVTGQAIVRQAPES